MRSRGLRWLVALAGIATAGALYQSACISFAGSQLLRTVDFCFVFDCQNGAFGGLVDPCSDQNVDVDNDGNEQTTNLFVDCPPPETQ